MGVLSDYGTPHEVLFERSASTPRALPDHYVNRYRNRQALTDYAYPTVSKICTDSNPIQMDCIGSRDREVIRDYLV